MRRNLIPLLALLAAGCTDADNQGPGGGIAQCGNNVLEQGEECDDGNPRNNDGCSNKCRKEDRSICGNGVLEEGEECDDNNRQNGDGCNRSCIDENRLNCGNDQMDPGEECDDGNRFVGDGCDDFCRAEGNACGNGQRSLAGGDVSAEACDDGNAEDGDGCSSSCVCEDDPDDHADDAANANAYDFEAESVTAILGCGDRDFWSLNVTEAGIYRFRSDGTTDPLCSILLENGDTLSRDDDGVPSSLNCDVGAPLEAGTNYFLEVHHFKELYGTGAYSLAWSRATDDDHGDTEANATVLDSLPSERSGRIDWSRDNDVFSLIMPAAGTLIMAVESEEMDPVCTLRDADFAMIAQNDDIDRDARNFGCRLDEALDEGQQVFLVVQPWSSERSPFGRPGAYRLTVRTTE